MLRQLIYHRPSEHEKLEELESHLEKNNAAPMAAPYGDCLLPISTIQKTLYPPFAGDKTHNDEVLTSSTQKFVQVVAVNIINAYVIGFKNE